MPTADRVAQFLDAEKPKVDMDTARLQLKTFLGKAEGKRVVVITAGGTSVPLERHTVRALENFSSGLRGTQLAERVLADDADCLVIFLHRQHAPLPFIRRAHALVDEMVGVAGPWSLPVPGRAASSLTGFPPVREHSIKTSNDFFTALEKASSALKTLDTVGSELQSCFELNGRLLCLPFVTVADYMHLLKTVAEEARPLGPNAAFFLAAAVSDFYLPSSK